MNRQGNISLQISTRKVTKADAIQTAFDWLRNGISKQGEIINSKKYSLRDMTKESDISKADAEFICKELQRRGFLKTYILEDSKQAIDFVTYLTDFWDWEKSPSMILKPLLLIWNHCRKKQKRNRKKSTKLCRKKT
jgi:hypothetical protein